MKNKNVSYSEDGKLNTDSLQGTGMFFRFLLTGSNFGKIFPCILGNYSNSLKRFL
jgi:hypothetical protein